MPPHFGDARLRVRGGVEIPAGWPVIISPADHERLVALATARKRGLKSSTASTNMLAGFLVRQVRSEDALHDVEGPPSLRRQMQRMAAAARCRSPPTAPRPGCSTWSSPNLTLTTSPVRS